MTIVLVIDDEKALLQDVCDLLELEGFETRSAVDGQKGFEAIRRQLPDLVICDAMMPNMNGYELLQQLRQDDAYGKLPFIFLSAKTTEEDIAYAMNLGANAYVKKPFTTQELIAAIRQFVA